jgi:hypothetical protein
MNAASRVRVRVGKIFSPLLAHREANHAGAVTQLQSSIQAIDFNRKQSSGTSHSSFGRSKGANNPSQAKGTGKAEDDSVHTREDRRRERLDSMREKSPVPPIGASNVYAHPSSAGDESRAETTTAFGTTYSASGTNPARANAKDISSMPPGFVTQDTAVAWDELHPGEELDHHPAAVTWQQQQDSPKPSVLSRR